MPKINGLEPHEIVGDVANAVPEWFEKLNIVVGLWCLGAAIMCFKSEHPELYAWLSIIVMFLILVALRRYFPPHIQELRKKKNKTDLEQVILKGCQSHFFGIKTSLLPLSLYWIGFGSLFAIASGFKGFFLTKVLPLLT